MDDGFKTYLVDYEHEGKQWMFELPARNWDDAEARLASIMTAHVAGEGWRQFSVRMGFLVKGLVRFLNFLSGRR